MPPTITLKVSGSLLDAEGTATLADTLAPALPGTRIVLVHGGGPQLDDALSKLDEPVRHHRGLRVTSRAQAGIVQATLDGVGSELARGLREHGLEAEHVDSLQRSLVAEPKRLDDGVDLGRVGTPVRFDVQALPEPPTVPVVTPVGTDGTGPLNVNADEAAAAIAQATDSHALVFATSTPGVLDETGTPLSRLDPPQARLLLDTGVATDGMQPKLEAALSVLATDVDEVHLGPLTSEILDAALEGEPAAGTRIADAQEAPA